MQELICVVMGDHGVKFIDMCFESLLDADKIIFCWGEEDIKTKEKYEIWKERYPEKFELISSSYNQKDKGMNGKQRNFYLDYLKKNHKNKWALITDLDEVVEDGGIKQIKKIINMIKPEAQDYLFSPRMRHLIGDLANEDNTQNVHTVLNRLFRVREDLSYPLKEHPVLTSKDNLLANLMNVTIWHLSYITGMFDIKKKYINHLKKSQMHSQDYLDYWYHRHILGFYERKRFSPLELPDPILKEFMLNRDSMYFSTHKELEGKHFMMIDQWTKKFNASNLLDLGCGLGLFGMACKLMKIKWKGMELSKWAVDNSRKELDIEQGDILDKKEYVDYDLVLVVDILEHLEEKDLETALENIKTYGKNFVFSIPFLGDPNLDQDITHKIKQSKEWWIEKLSKYFKIELAPTDWSFNQQILIGDAK